MRFEPVTLLALRVIADAVARAHAGQVERGWGHRLALRWLVDAGIAEPWQARDFWADLAMQWDAPEFESNAAYSQVSRLHGALAQWSYRAGMAPPDPVETHRLARPWMPDLEFDCGTQQLPCMCNRYMPGDRHRVEDHFSARAQREFNAGPAIVHPREPGWVVRLVAGERVLEQMTWGFPVYLRGKAGQPLKARPVNNARFDKLGGYWKRWAADPASRCLIPAAAYAEAVGPAGAMTTTWLSVKDAPVFAWAGLWRPSDEWGACYTGVMTDNAPGLEAIHDRSPVILGPEDWETWLHAPLEDLRRFDRPCPAERITVTPTDVLWKHGGREPPASLFHRASGMW